MIRFKLGSQIWDDEDNFMWSICYLDERGANAIAYVPLGVRHIHDPVIAKARELIKLLNEEK